MSAVIASTTPWQVGIAVGIAVIAVAAAIVITIVLLAMRIAKQAKTAVDAVEVVRQQTDELGGIAPDQRLGRADPARRPVAAEGGGREVNLLALTSNGYWTIALGIGAVAAVVVAILLGVLIVTRPEHREVGRRPARDRGRRSARTRRTSRSSRRPRRCSALIVTEAVVQDGYMNALTDGYGGR